MNDFFTELVVARKPQFTDGLIRGALILFTILAALAGLFIHPLFFLIFLVFLACDYFIFPRLNVEYEYSYVNGDIHIAAVFSKKSRKELTDVDLAKAECIAPEGSVHLNDYGNTYSVCDYSAKDPDDRPYVAVMGGPEPKKIMLQLDQTMLDDLKHRMPRKVFTE